MRIVRYWIVERWVSAFGQSTSTADDCKQNATMVCVYRKLPNTSENVISCSSSESRVHKLSKKFRAASKF